MGGWGWGGGGGGGTETEADSPVAVEMSGTLATRRVNRCRCTNRILTVPLAET